MGIPGTAGLDVAHPPSRVFTPGEADRLLPSIEAILRETDRRAARLGEVRDLVDDLERYWGDRLSDPAAADHGTWARLVRERDDLQDSLSEDIRRIHDLGALLKDLDQGLVDFYGRVEDSLVFLCWRRGEDRIRFYHSLEGGFAARRPLAPIPRE